MKSGRFTRRSFIAGILAGAGAAPMVVPSRVMGLGGATSPSNRIALGFIGVGTHGFGYNLKAFLKESDAQAVAVCDVFGSRRNQAKELVNRTYETKDCRDYADFRDLLAAKDIDAVCISTPDHWHVPISMMAMAAGKDVMCEKPTLTISEGRRLVEEVVKRRAVFQVGLEDRSVTQYHRMAELVRNGAIGKLKSIHVKLPAGQVFPKEESAPVPPDLNWNLWLGPAPLHPYTPTRTGPQEWRNIRDYSGGKFADWGSHLLDTAQVANFAERSGPVEVEGTGEVPDDSMTTMPVTYKVKYRYANGVELFVESGGIELRFEGADGWIGNTGWRGALQASSAEILKQSVPAESNKLWPIPASEHRNFLDCIRSRREPTYSAEDGHRLSTVMHIGNIAIERGRKLKWDPAKESFLNDEPANRLRSREQRHDWKT